MLYIVALVRFNDSFLTNDAIIKHRDYNIFENPRNYSHSKLYTYLRSAGAAGNGEDAHDLVKARGLSLLPSFYFSIDRYMRQQWFDNVVISNSVGHPNFFITMTCSTVWSKITRVILEKPENSGSS